MTDSQWLWLYANQILDNDEKLEHMCPSCRAEAENTNRCIRCGKPIGSRSNQFINPNFDNERFERLSNE